MNKRGFVFVETILAVVVLSTSLLLLYTTFNNILQSEKTRVYFDDASFIFRTYYLKDRVSHLNLANILSELTDNDDKYFVTVGLENDKLFENYENVKDFMQIMINNFEVSQMIILKENKIDNIRNCTEDGRENVDGALVNSPACNEVYLNLTREMIDYIKSIYIDISTSYIFITEYAVCDKNTGNCRSYYSWVGV